MAGKDSTQHWLDRNRPPRVQITYDVETGGASEKKELPMVMGILADLSGNLPDTKPAKMKERKFVEIDRDNLNTVMKRITPRVKLEIADAAGAKTPVELKLESMDDFDPKNLVTQVDSLKVLFERRRALNDMLAKLDGNDQLEAALQKVIEDKTFLDALKTQLEAEIAKL